jgi:hypothetical protein
MHQIRKLPFEDKIGLHDFFYVASFENLAVMLVHIIDILEVVTSEENSILIIFSEDTESHSKNY